MKPIAWDDRSQPRQAMIVSGGPRGRVFIAAGMTDTRKDMAGLSALIQAQLREQPFSGDVFAFLVATGNAGSGPSLAEQRTSQL